MSWVMVLFGVLLVLVVFVVMVYNNLVRQRNEVVNAFGQIDIQLTRRHDLIPNLVEVAKRYMEHEQATLIAVTEARNVAMSALTSAKTDDSNGAIGQLGIAESALGANMSALMATFENYPDLKADEQMLALQEALESTENRIAFARQHYNDNVTAYNTTREVFPNNLVAGFFAFREQAWLEIDAIADKRAAVPVTFR